MNQLLDSHGQPMQSQTPEETPLTEDEQKQQAHLRMVQELSQLANQDRRVGEACAIAEQSTFEGWMKANLTDEQRADLKQTCLDNFIKTARESIAFYRHLDEANEKFLARYHPQAEEVVDESVEGEDDEATE